MWDAPFWNDERLTGASAQRLAADPEPQIAFQEMEDLVLAPVDVERRGVAVRGLVLQHGNPVRSVIGGEADCDACVQEPEFLG